MRKMFYDFFLKRSCLFIILSIFGFGFMQSQNLNQKQMLEDLVFLGSHINKYCSFLPLLEQRTNTSFCYEFDNIKQKINETTTQAQFVDLVRQTLNIINDGHSGIVRNKQSVIYYTGDKNYLNKVGNVLLSDTLNISYNYSFISDSVYSKLKCWARFKYMDGHYYNVRPFTTDSIFIGSGEEITEIDGNPINDFIYKNRYQMYFLMWDPTLKQWYNELFMLALPQLGKQKFRLKIGGKSILLDCYKPLDDIKYEHSQSSGQAKVMMINKDILYIYMPQMVDSDWYINELTESYSSKIKKIIIDIRGNGGGKDSAWQDILKKIISKPFKYRFHISFNSDEILDNSLSDLFGKQYYNGRYSVVENDITLNPDTNSVNFNGKIYILQDKNTYSAASALASIAWQNDDIISLGEPSAFISGYTFPALMFKLPNSSIVFNLAFSTDMNGGNNNPYMDKPEIEMIDNNIFEYLDKCMNYDYYNKDYLIGEDKLIKYVIND